MNRTNEPTSLGIPFQGLMMTNSSAAPRYNKEPNAPESAPIEPSDIPKILDILMPCPIGPFELRVPQQGAAGTCWQDSLLTMLYNADWFKPTLRNHIEFYMAQFFASGFTDLIYGESKEVNVPNYSQSKYNITTRKYVGPTIKTTIRNTVTKIHTIAKLFKKTYDLGLPLAFWEYYCLNLHRYILLGYMFLKFPESAAPAELTAAQPSRLFARRKSIGKANYTRLHIDFKGHVFYFPYHGLECSNFNTARDWFMRFISATSAGTYAMKQFADASVVDSSIEGYYLALGGQHVLSLFKCGGNWFLYDIDIGSTSFSAADSAKLDASRVQSFLFQDTQAGSFNYTLTLKDGATVQVEMPFFKKTLNHPSHKLKYDSLYEKFSFVLVRTASTPASASNASAAANSNGGAAAKGGLRKTRKRKTRRHK